MRETDFDEFGAFIAKREIAHDNIGAHMQQFVTDHKRSTKTTTALVSCNYVERHFFTTDQLKFYWNLGVEFEKIHAFYEYKPTTAVSKFVDTVTENRRAADEDPTMQSKADTLKLNGENYSLQFSSV